MLLDQRHLRAEPRCSGRRDQAGWTATITTSDNVHAALDSPNRRRDMLIEFDVQSIAAHAGFLSGSLALAAAVASASAFRAMRAINTVTISVAINPHRTYTF